jgi:hypothetical protein
MPIRANLLAPHWVESRGLAHSEATLGCQTPSWSTDTLPTNHDKYSSAAGTFGSTDMELSSEAKLQAFATSCWNATLMPNFGDGGFQSNCAKK